MSFVILFFKFFVLFLFFIPLYCFVLYPIILILLSFFSNSSKSTSSSHESFSKISFLLPAFNEETFIQDKLNNLSQIIHQNYSIEILVCDDGSTDKTLAIVKNWIAKNDQATVKLIANKTNQGKWNCLKKMVEIADGEILVFSDISAILPSNFLIKMIPVMARSDIAVYAPTYSFHANTKNLLWEKIYWPLEKFIRSRESKWFSTIGAHGSCYALKKNDLINLHLAETNGAAPINDDFIIPSLSALNSGKKIYYDIELEIHEHETTPAKVEYQRRIRIARGNFLMNHFFVKKISWRMNTNFFFLTMSHKILRSYIGPALSINFLLYSFLPWGDLRYNVISLIFFIALMALSPIRASTQVFFFDRFTSKKRWK